MVEQGRRGVGTLDRSVLGAGVVELLTGERGTKTEAIDCPGGLAADVVWVLSPLSCGSDGLYGLYGLYVRLLFGLRSGLDVRSSELQADVCIE